MKKLVTVLLFLLINPATTIGQQSYSGIMGPTGGNGVAGATGATGPAGVGFSCPHVGTPTIHGASGASNCGTGATVSGTDCSAAVTIGVGYIGGCLLDFAHTWTTTPVCAARVEIDPIHNCTVNDLAGSVPTFVVGPCIPAASATDTTPTTTQNALDAGDNAITKIAVICSNLP